MKLKSNTFELAVTMLVVGCGSPIIGAECAEGFVACDRVCVDLQSSRLNCGACGTACPGTSICIAGICGVRSDGGFDDSDTGDMPLDTPPSDAGSTDTGDADRGDMGSGDPSVRDDVGVVDADDVGVVNADDVGVVDADDVGVVDADDVGVVDADDVGVVDADDVGVADADDVGVVDAGDADMPSCVCDIGEICCDGVCVLPDRDRSNCGGCDIVCDVTEFCADSSCEPICAPPLELCGNVCIDTGTDRDNCGGCGALCASGICTDGVCASMSEGHVILIGHDYSVGRIGQNFLAGNSVFIPLGDSVPVLVFEGDAIDSAIRGVDNAIDQVAARVGRRWTRMEASSPEEVPLLLQAAQVFVVYAQSGASDAMLRANGQVWATALMSFLRRGGVVLVFDGGGINAGTWQVLAGAELLDAGGRVSVRDEVLTVVERGDAIARSVPEMYLGEEETVHFLSAPSGAVVVEHPDGPVVIHEVLSP